MTPSEVTALNADVSQFLHIVWLILASAAGLGITTMVILQLAKDLLPIRSVWQRKHISHWLREQANLAYQFEREQVRSFDNADSFSVPPWNLPPKDWVAKQDLIKLACAGRPRAFYSLAVEQLAGQASTAAQFVVDYPAGHEDLLRILATGTSIFDLDILFRAAREPYAIGSDEMQKLVDSRTRISHLVQRNLDAFQISIASRWKLYLQIVAIVLSVVLMCFLVWVFPLNRGALEYIQAAVIGVLGGFMSSAVWDLFGLIRARPERV